MRIRTEQMRSVFDKFGSACWADRRSRYLAAAVIFRYSQYFRDNVVAAPYKHAATFCQFLSFDVVVVVQRCAAYGCSAQFDRSDMRKRRDFARSSDVPLDFFERRGRFFRFEFVGNCPFREFIGIAERFSYCEIVDFYNHSVNEKIEFIAIDRLNFIDDFLYIRRTIQHFGFESVFP